MTTQNRTLISGLTEKDKEIAKKVSLIFNSEENMSAGIRIALRVLAVDYINKLEGNQTDYQDKINDLLNEIVNKKQ